MLRGALDTTAAGHIDTALPAELTWGPLAAADGAAPTFDGTGCSSTYCHGETLLPGGLLTEPSWTTVDGTQDACGTCHGIPPGGSHPADTNCQNCHGDVIGAGLRFVDRTLHINGVVDVTFGSCESCHGGGGSAAPPQDTTGGTSPTLRGVGAHRQHLGSSGWHAPIGCTECHLVPATYDATGHADSSLPAELMWGPLATAAGAAPGFDGTRCGGTYCHGDTMAPGGGTITDPLWTTVDGTQDACGTCHGLPPGGTHTTDTRCENCHGAVIGPGGVWVAPSLHVDGTVEVSYGGCETCHGGAGSAAPPEDTTGGTSTALRGIGAHRSHLGPSTWHAEVRCSECHRVPATPTAAGHMDTPLPAEMTWGPLAGADGAIPIRQRVARHVCHGETLLPADRDAPGLTTLDGTQDACGPATACLRATHPTDGAGAVPRNGCRAGRTSWRRRCTTHRRTHRLPPGGLSAPARTGRKVRRRTRLARPARPDRSAARSVPARAATRASAPLHVLPRRTDNLTGAP